MNIIKGKVNKRLVLVAVQLLLLFPVSVCAQTDSSSVSPLDSLSPEQLQLYYVNEPEPPQYYKGPTVGDTLYYELLPLTVPTETVEGQALILNRSEQEEIMPEPADTSTGGSQHLKPKISLGTGKLAYHGDLYDRKFKSPTTGRTAFDLSISQRLTGFLQLDFTAMFGSLGANEWLENRHENFKSEIRSGGVNLLYDFGNFVPAYHRVRPFVSLGLSGFEFLSKTDLRDQSGNTYYYWSDGSIKDKAEGSANAQFANTLQRDYKYESDIRELNRDGFGKYAERAWAMPLGVGAIMKVTHRFDVKINFQYFFSTTDYIDGITNRGVGARTGNRRMDNFTYTSFGIQYDLISRPRKRTFTDTLTSEQWLAFDTEDRDQDGVIDFSDDCHGTEAGVKVDERGCPVDDDADGIPNYRDDELASAPGALVNGRGVTQDDAYWLAWYNDYMNDTAASNVETVVIGNIFQKETRKIRKKKSGDIYTVELVRYNGSIPTDELAFLLSIGDITSTTLPDGTTVVYTSGNYDKVGTAIKRRDEFRLSGNKGAGISKLKGNDIIKVPEDELETLLQGELEELLNVDITDSSGTEAFGKDAIVYRVQLGAFKNKISPGVFNTSAGVLELKTGESVFRYVTKGYRTIEEAASVRADLVIQGYSDAFVTAYKDGKRIPMNQTSATVEKGYKEDMNENKIFSSIDKKLVSYKVQLGPLKKKFLEASMDEKVKELSNVEKQTTATGSLRYMTGNFSSFAEADKHRKQLEEKGFADAFVIAMFKDEIISIQEAKEFLDQSSSK
jgi:hypothetical protein